MLLDGVKGAKGLTPRVTQRSRGNRGAESVKGLTPRAPRTQRTPRK